MTAPDDGTASVPPDPLEVDQPVTAVATAEPATATAAALVPVQPGPPGAAATASAWGFESELALLGRLPAATQAAWQVAQSHLGVSDTELDAAEVAGLQVRAVSTRGIEHRLHATVRQDAYALTVSAAGGWLLLGVSDGVGSAPDSHLGARLATRSALQHLRGRLDAEGADGWDGLAQAAATEAATRVEHDERACTLVVAAVELQPAGPVHQVLLARVGDSTALRLSAGSLADCFADQSTDRTTDRAPDCTSDRSADSDLEAVHSTATDCLPRHPERVAVARTELPAGTALLLASDGFYNPALTAAGAAHLAGSWAVPPGLDRLLTDVHLLARTHDDDRTAVGCWVPAAEDMA